MRRFVQRDGDSILIDQEKYDLKNFRHVWLVGAGKAGASMACAAVDLLEDRLSGGVVIVKEGYKDPSGFINLKGLRNLSGLQILEASHPLPDGRGVAATRAIVALLEARQPDDLVICLISGGGSALLTAPSPGVSLEDLQTLTRLLLACGASIDEINTLRKHLDQVKGGQLARLTFPARLATLILSDVVGSPLDVIASGPAVPDPTTFEDAYTVLSRYALLEKTPASILHHLECGRSGEIPETPKPGDPIFSTVQHVVIGSNHQAAEAAIKQAHQEGFNPLLLTTYLQGEARQAGRTLGAVARQVNATGQPVRRPACIVAGGETTVTLRGDGLGGRNLELALGAVVELDGLPDSALVTLATDGGDGPTDAAGAVVTGETMLRALRLGIHPADYLNRNDSYHFFEALGDLVITGPTGTNVNDLAFLFAF
jgi:hydroxypyruvate reductase